MPGNLSKLSTGNLIAYEYPPGIKISEISVESIRGHWSILGPFPKDMEVFKIDSWCLWWRMGCKMMERSWLDFSSLLHLALWSKHSLSNKHQWHGQLDVEQEVHLKVRKKIIRNWFSETLAIFLIFRKAIFWNRSIFSIQKIFHFQKKVFLTFLFACCNPITYLLYFPQSKNSNSVP